jgi:hypothetical protein
MVTWNHSAADVEPREHGDARGAGSLGEFEHHFRSALLRTKVPLVQMHEILLHISQYCGMATGAEIWKIARRVLSARRTSI